MDFAYGESFTESSPEAYERLILDVLLGDANLFPRHQEVELSWNILDPIEEYWDTHGKPAQYAVGHLGPGRGGRDARTRRQELAPAMKIDLTDTTSSKINAALIEARRAIGTPAVGMVLTLVIVTDEGNAYDALQGRATRPPASTPRASSSSSSGRPLAPGAAPTPGWTPRCWSAPTPAPARRSCCACTASWPTTPSPWSCRCCCRTRPSWSGGPRTRPTTRRKDPLGALAQRRITDAAPPRTRSARSARGPRRTRPATPTWPGPGSPRGARCWPPPWTRSTAEVDRRGGRGRGVQPEHRAARRCGSPTGWASRWSARSPTAPASPRCA